MEAFVAFKSPTTVDEACETNPFAKVPRPVSESVPLVSEPIVALLEKRLVEEANPEV